MILGRAWNRRSDRFLERKMSLRASVAQGVQAGLLAGVAVAGFFFIGDLVRFEPLSTPNALIAQIVGPGGVTLDVPLIGWAVAAVIFGAQLLKLTILHFLVFAVLGLSLVALRDRVGLPLNVGTGALFGLIVCTLVFYLSVAAVSGGVLSGVPSFWAIVAANGLAGAIMGGYCSDPDPV